MSQVPTQTCPKCYMRVSPSQPFCPNCGANLVNVGNVIPPTMAASSGSWQPPQQNSGEGFLPTVAASPGVQPNSGGYDATPPPPIGLPNSSYGSPSGYDPYGGLSTPPPPPTDPYAASSSPSPYSPPPAQPGQYMSPGMPGPYGIPAKKKSPVLYIVLGIVIAVLVVCGGSTWAATKALNSDSTSSSGGDSSSSSSGGSGQFASQQKIDLSIVYSSVQFNFTSLQQASKFSDDSMSGLSYNSNKNYVRVNFQEKQTSQKSSYFSYRSAFLLVLPDKTTTSATQAQEYSGPEGGVVRTNWVDFELSKQVDLSKLSLRLGSSDEAQMTVDLKTGADVGKYKPQQSTFNKSFQYAGMSWIFKDATQVYYNNGKQAKNGKVFVLVDLTASNPADNGTVYLYSGFIRLKSGDTVTAPNYDSNMDDFDIVEAGTSNLQGTAIFETPSASSYTLTFTSGKNISPASVDFSMGSGS